MLPSGKNIRLFKHPVLERLTYVHPAMPALLWGPLAVYCFAAGLFTPDANARLSIVQTTLLTLSGVGVWTLTEYLMHRFVFHFKPRGGIQERISFLIHGIHHEDPGDARRLLMPPAAAAILAVFFWTLFTALLGPVVMKPFFSGFLIGYLVYDYTHFAVHFMMPRWRVMKALKRNHLIHHYSTPDQRYGVGSTFWDYVFRTR